jgi:hypothetical protein
MWWLWGCGGFGDVVAHWGCGGSMGMLWLQRMWLFSCVDVLAQFWGCGG